jgi:hypothetical protein
MAGHKCKFRHGPDMGGPEEEDGQFSRGETYCFWSCPELKTIVTYKGFTWLTITGSGLDDWIYWHFYYNYNQLWQLTISDCLRLAPFLTGPRVSSLLLWLTWVWFTGRPLLQLRLLWTTTVLRITERVWVLCYDRRSVGQSVL